MYKIILVLITLFISLSFMPLTHAQAPESWTVRCDEGNAEKKHCEIFQRLVTKDSGRRLMEFAIGIPPGEDTPRGVVVMPLGILLEPGVELMIDDTHNFKFNVRFCNKNGCIAYLRLNDNVLNAMRKGNEAKIIFTLPNYKKANIPFSLKGFTKAYKRLG